MMRCGCSSAPLENTVLPYSLSCLPLGPAAGRLVGAALALTVLAGQETGCLTSRRAQKGWCQHPRSPWPHAGGAQDPPWGNASRLASEQELRLLPAPGSPAPLQQHSCLPNLVTHTRTLLERATV